MSRLSIEYFRHITNSDGYSVYGKPSDSISSPIVLFSEIDGSALASLHFKLSGRYGAQIDKDSRTVLAPFKSFLQEQMEIQRFQGLINKENQEFEFVITNLCANGYINFNLMKTNEDVTETNPGGINEINELRPFESYAVRCDQINNLPMILQKYKDQIGNTMTVEKDENEQKETKKGSKGTNIYLNVAPQDTCKEMVALFERTTWKVTELIPIKYTGIQYGGMRAIPQCMDARDTSYDISDYSDELEEECSDLGADYFSEISHLPEAGSSGGFIGAQGSPGHPGYPGPQGPRGREHDSDSDSDNAESFNSKFEKVKCKMGNEEVKCKKMGNGKAKCQKMANEIQIDDDDEICENDYKREINTEGINQKILESEVGKVVYGDTKIEVNGHQTDIMYDYTKTSKPCVLGLSINERLEFTPINERQRYEEMVNNANELIKELINKKYDEFLKGKIYEANDCVVCLTEGCDCVLFECGHKCGHYACLQSLEKCPLCRSYIYAKINMTVYVPKVIPEVPINNQVLVAN